MNPPDDFARRLRQLTGEFGSRYALAKASGIPASTLQSYEAGSKPGVDALVRLARVGNIDLNWLASGTGQMRPPGMLPSDAFADILMVDQYRLGTAEAMEVIIGHIPFSRNFLEKNLGLKEPSQKTLLVVQAGSNLYGIKRGDLVLIDRSEANLWRDGIYLLDLPGMELRGLFVYPGDKVRVVGPEQQGARRGLNEAVRGRRRQDEGWLTMSRSELLGVGRNAVSKVVGRAVWTGGAL